MYSASISTSIVVLSIHSRERTYCNVIVHWLEFFSFAPCNATAPQCDNGPHSHTAPECDNGPHSHTAPQCDNGPHSHTAPNCCCSINVWRLTPKIERMPCCVILCVTNTDDDYPMSSVLCAELTGDGDDPRPHVLLCAETEPNQVYSTRT